MIISVDEIVFNIHYRLQSKSLTSDSGVVFSPPSIVKDALGDSGLLMDTEGPSSNVSHLDDDKPTQVLIQSSVKAIHQSAQRYAMPNQSHQHNQHIQMYQQPHHPSAHEEHFGKQPPQTTQQPFNNVHLELEPINTSSFKQLPSNQTKSSSLVPNHYLYHTQNPRTKPSPNAKPTTRYPMSQSASQPPNKEHSFNPFADENDRSANHFQLSKTESSIPPKPTQNGNLANGGRPIESSPFARTFGFNRTNLMWTTGNPNGGGLKVEAQPSGTLATHLHTSPNVSRFQIRTSSSTSNRSPTSGDSARLQAFRPLLPVDPTAVGRPGSGNGKTSGASPYRSSSANHHRTDQMQFKCFDLSDEAGWLNFE